jgi:hypothetical protein
MNAERHGKTACDDADPANNNVHAFRTTPSIDDKIYYT